MTSKDNISRSKKKFRAEDYVKFSGRFWFQNLMIVK